MNANTIVRTKSKEINNATYINSYKDAYGIKVATVRLANGKLVECLYSELVSVSF
jgi:hypothetical protein